MLAASSLMRAGFPNVLNAAEHLRVRKALPALCGRAEAVRCTDFAAPCVARPRGLSSRHGCDRTGLAARYNGTLSRAVTWHSPRGFASPSTEIAGSPLGSGGMG